MGEDDIASSAAHIVLCAVAGGTAGRMLQNQLGKCVHPGMHGNLFIHGIIGFLSSTGSLGVDVSGVYPISAAAAKYLPLQCLMADLYWENNQPVAVAHILSGLVPLALNLAGSPIPEVGYAVCVGNILSCAYWAFNNDNMVWAYGCAGAAAFTYFAAPHTGQRFLFPLGLAAMEFCAFRIFLELDSFFGLRRGKKGKAKKGSKPSSPRPKSPPKKKK